MNNACWTGIYVWLPPDTRVRFLEIARRVSTHSEPVDGNWILWRFWQPLSSASVEGLHEHLTGSQREAEQQEIVNEIEEWKYGFEKTLAQLG